MNNYYYYLGFLFIFDLLKSLYVSFKPVKKEETVNITNNMELTELIDAKEKLKSKTPIIEKAVFWLIHLVFIAWTIVGYTSHTPERIWFLFLLLVIIINIAIWMAIAVYFTYSSIFSHRAKISNDTDNSKGNINIPIEKIVHLTELILVSTILFHHFILN
jgi:hypothetical protein